jgi:hypothetical protein
VKKGELLAEIDSRKGRLAAETARLAFLTASAELKRVRIGTVILENREQPERAAIDVKALESQVAILHEEAAAREKLFEQSLVTKQQLLESQRILAETEQALGAAQLSLQTSVPGKSESERIAANGMQTTTLQWQEALEELNDYRVVAPVDGIVDRVLVHAGEFNTLPGSTALVIEAGLWFDGYFDQSAVGQFERGAVAEVHLAAHPEATFTGHVAFVNPIVRYSTGGPETGQQPVRAIGAGAPEWPATFQTRVELEPDAVATLVPGLTGFVRVTLERTSVAVPQGAVTSMSAGSGVIFAVHGGEWQVKRARYGAANDGWTEIVDGVAPGDKVIVEGQLALEPGDRIRESPW